MQNIFNSLAQGVQGQVVPAIAENWNGSGLDQTPQEGLVLYLWAGTSRIGSKSEQKMHLLGSMLDRSRRKIARRLMCNTAQARQRSESIPDFDRGMFQAIASGIHGRESVVRWKSSLLQRQSGVS